MSDKPRRAKTSRELSQDPRRLKRRRIVARMNQSELALKAGCSAPYLCELEKGTYSASPAILGGLADALGCDITDLMPAETVAA
jgi:transcriptional regulator with XRE-family HTH domain